MYTCKSSQTHVSVLMPSLLSAVCHSTNVYRLACQQDLYYVHRYYSSLFTGWGSHPIGRGDMYFEIRRVTCIIGVSLSKPHLVMSMAAQSVALVHFGLLVASVMCKTYLSALNFEYVQYCTYILVSWWPRAMRNLSTLNLECILHVHTVT